MSGLRIVTEADIMRRAEADVADILALVNRQTIAVDDRNITLTEPGLLGVPHARVVPMPFIDGRVWRSWLRLRRGGEWEEGWYLMEFIETDPPNGAAMRWTIKVRRVLVADPPRWGTGEIRSKAPGR